MFVVLDSASRRKNLHFFLSRLMNSAVALALFLSSTHVAHLAVAGGEERKSAGPSSVQPSDSQSCEGTLTGLQSQLKAPFEGAPSPETFLRKFHLYKPAAAEHIIEQGLVDQIQMAYTLWSLMSDQTFPQVFMSHFVTATSRLVRTGDAEKYITYAEKVFDAVPEEHLFSILKVQDRMESHNVSGLSNQVLNQIVALFIASVASDFLQSLINPIDDEDNLSDKVLSFWSNGDLIENLALSAHFFIDQFSEIEKFHAVLAKPTKTIGVGRLSFEIEPHLQAYAMNKDLALSARMLLDSPHFWRILKTPIGIRSGLTWEWYKSLKGNDAKFKDILALKVLTDLRGDLVKIASKTLYVERSDQNPVQDGERVFGERPLHPDTDIMFPNTIAWLLKPHGEPTRQTEMVARWLWESVGSDAKRPFLSGPESPSWKNHVEKITKILVDSIRIEATNYHIQKQFEFSEMELVRRLQALQHEARNSVPKSDIFAELKPQNPQRHSQRQLSSRVPRLEPSPPSASELTLPKTLGYPSLPEDFAQIEPGQVYEFMMSNGRDSLMKQKQIVRFSEDVVEGLRATPGKGAKFIGPLLLGFVGSDKPMGGIKKRKSAFRGYTHEIRPGRDGHRILLNLNESFSPPLLDAGLYSSKQEL